VSRGERIVVELVASDIVGSTLLMTGELADVDAVVVEPTRSLRGNSYRWSGIWPPIPTRASPCFNISPGSPNHHVPRFQTMAAVSNANTMAKPATKPPSQNGPVRNGLDRASRFCIIRRWRPPACGARSRDLQATSSNRRQREEVQVQSQCERWLRQ
jgi:hypothetical protein